MLFQLPALSRLALSTVLPTRQSLFLEKMVELVKKNPALMDGILLYDKLLRLNKKERPATIRGYPLANSI